MQWLPEAPGAISSQVLALSNNGFAAGSTVLPANPPGSRVHSSGAVWDGEGLHVIPAPPGTFPNVAMTAINDRGRAVGYYDLGPYRAIVWQSEQVTDLAAITMPSPPTGMDSAWAIDNQGKIVVHFALGTAILTPVWTQGDLTGDCHVGLDDLVILLSSFGSPQGTYPRGDVNGDGQVDLADLTALLAHWGE